MKALVVALVLMTSGIPCTVGAQTFTELRVQTPPGESGFAAPAWAPDSQHLAVVGWSIWGPLRFLISGIYAGDIEILGFWALPCYGCENLYWDPAWSPDMSQLAFTEDGRLLIASVHDTVITDPGNLWGTQPVWSPDGSRIAFVQNGIVTIPATGGTPVFLATGNNPAWSPDGNWIAYDAASGGNRTLWRIPASGGTPEALPHGPGDAEHPTWSPDGALLAFSSNRDGNQDIWVMRIANGNLSRLTNDAAVDSEPTWSPDGQKIAFVSDRFGDTGIVIATDLSTVPVESVSWSSVKTTYR